MHIYKFSPKTNSHPNDDNSPQIPKKNTPFREKQSDKTTGDFHKNSQKFIQTQPDVSPPPSTAPSDGGKTPCNKCNKCNTTPLRTTQS